MNVAFSSLESGLLVSLGCVALIAVLSGVILDRRNKKVKARLKTVERILGGFPPFEEAEQNFERLLEWFGEEVAASSYAFYLYDEKHRRFTLKAVRKWSDQEALIAPSYSGLVPYKGVEYHPPLNLETGKETEKVGVVQSGEISLINLRLNDQALVRMGPVMSVSRKKLAQLSQMATYLKDPVQHMIDGSKYRVKTDVLETTERAIQTVSQITLNPYTMVESLFYSTLHAFQVSSGLFVCVKDPKPFLLCDQGLAPSFLTKLEQELEQASVSDQLLKGSGFKAIDRENPLFKKLPLAIQERTRRLVTIQRIRLQQEIGYFICFFDELDLSESESREKLGSFKVIGQKLETAIKFQGQTDRLNQATIEKLKLMAQMVDHLQPHTIGYSEMMSRFSIILAKEMGLSPDEVVNVGLAAYLSNIGVIGLSDVLLHKEGAYTDIEFEQMKSHAEVGAAIIMNMLGNAQMASYIRYHHERIDGNGYPEGIQQEDIPIGARIIAVVQTFLAKINGRSYRPALSFDKALEVLQSAAGTQLDEEVVRHFIQWFQKKRRDPLIKGRSLGTCWDMCCVPASICVTCPAYGVQEKNCWEIETNHCRAHGRECSTCFVYTEAKGRQAAII